MKRSFSEFFQKLRSFFSSKEELTLFTDGSSKRGRGAWAFVVTRRGKLIYEASAKVKKSGNNPMELQAAIEALKWLPVPSDATLYSDSRILIDAMTLDMPQWKLLGWVKKGNRPIVNLEMFQELDALNQKHFIRWKWIRAHSGVEFNERCDELCRALFLGILSFVARGTGTSW